MSLAVALSACSPGTQHQGAGPIGSRSVTAPTSNDANGGNASSPPVVSSDPRPTRSEYPVDAEWRAEFNASVPEAAGVMDRSTRESSRRLEACMRHKGFVFSVGEPVGPEVDRRVARNPLSKWTLGYGYHLPPSPAVVGGTTITPEMELALDGGDIAPERTSEVVAKIDTPCSLDKSVIEANRAVSAVDERWITLVIELTQRVAEYDNTEQAQELMASWSECMARSGYSFPNQSVPRLQFSSTASVSAIELRTRQADFDCDIAVRLTATRSDWQRAQYDAWRTERAEAISEFARIARDAADALDALESEAL